MFIPGYYEEERYGQLPPEYQPEYQEYEEFPMAKEEPPEMNNASGGAQESLSIEETKYVYCQIHI